LSGARLVLILFGSFVAVVGTILIGFAVFDPHSTPCAKGDLAENQVVDGHYVTRTETFGSVSDAEAFICHDVPELHADGWTLQTITAERSVSLDRMVDGVGVGFVTLGYVETATGRTLTIDSAPFLGTSYFASLIPEQHTEEPVEIKGAGATAYRFGINPNQVEVLWHAKTLEHRAVTQLESDFTLTDVLGLLETLK
jgi:hypothetical protein